MISQYVPDGPLYPGLGDFGHMYPAIWMYGVLAPISALFPPLDTQNK